MNGKGYVNAIVRKVRCGGKKKKEIKKQLLTDVQERLEQGESLDEVIARMGTAKEIAEGFNEDVTPEERERFVRGKVLKLTLCIAAALAFSGLLVYWSVPGMDGMEEGARFDRERVEAAMKETVELFDAGDYAALQEKSVSRIRPHLNAREMGEARGVLSADWGERKGFGQAEVLDVVQGGRHFAVGEIVVTYENVRAIVLSGIALAAMAIALLRA